MREFPAANPAEQPKPAVFSVSSLTRRIKDLLESGFSQIWVEGEISNLSRPASGHVYFSLKDQRSQIRCALFRGRGQQMTAELADGAQVLVRARLTMYEARGDTQLVVQHVEDAGEGALRRAFEALKGRLKEEGLFDERHKQPLPRLPARVGIITSLTGAAVRDILATFQRRCPAIPLLIHPVSVQGEQAVPEICAALQTASDRGECDVLILARGGGSLEDLQAFNDERVARAVFACPLPIVCGVGHESDITICDFVADQRAPTPTAAAELISPDATEWRESLRASETRITRLMRDRLEQKSQKVDWLGRLIVHPTRQLAARRDRLQARVDALQGTIRSRLQSRQLALLPLPARLLRSSPVSYLSGAANRINRAEERLAGSVKIAATTRRQRLERAVSRLDSVNPLAVLSRGYAMVTVPESGTIIRSVNQPDRNDPLDVRVSDGRLRCLVEGKYPDD